MFTCFIAKFNNEKEFVTMIDSFSFLVIENYGDK